MQTPLTNQQARELTDQVFSIDSDSVGMTDETRSSDQALPDQATSPVLFKGNYAGRMEMFADRQAVARYLDDHRTWFLKCAQPMMAEPLNDNGYALTVGNFGALGYHIEPKVGLHLLPQEQGIYRIETIPVPGYVTHGYDVDFKAALELNEHSGTMEMATADVESPLTQVDWELELRVWVHFPRFISALPKRLIQRTGDHLLSQIVRQASRCLTHKVQEDFHQSQGLPLPESYRKRNHHFLERFSPQTDQ